MPTDQEPRTGSSDSARRATLDALIQKEMDALGMGQGPQSGGQDYAGFLDSEINRLTKELGFDSSTFQAPRSPNVSPLAPPPVPGAPDPNMQKSPLGSAKQGLETIFPFAKLAGSDPARQFVKSTAAGATGVGLGGAGGMLQAGGAAAESVIPFGLGERFGGELRQAGRYLSDANEGVQQWAAPPDDALRNPLDSPEDLLDPMWWASVGGNAVGSMGPFMGAGVAAGAAIKAASAAGSLPPLLAQTLAKYGPAVAAGVMEAITEGSLAFDEAIRSGASDGEAARAAGEVTIVTAATAPALNKFGVFGEKLSGLPKAALSAGAESTQELIQQLTGTHAKRATYDPEAQYKEGVVESIVGGAFGGGLASPIIDTLMPGKPGPASPDAAPGIGPQPIFDARTGQPITLGPPAPQGPPIVDELIGEPPPPPAGAEQVIAPEKPVAPKSEAQAPLSPIRAEAYKIAEAEGIPLEAIEGLSDEQLQAFKDTVELEEKPADDVSATEAERPDELQPDRQPSEGEKQSPASPIAPSSPRPAEAPVKVGRPIVAPAETSGARSDQGGEQAPIAPNPAARLQQAVGDRTAGQKRPAEDSAPEQGASLSPLASILARNGRISDEQATALVEEYVSREMVEVDPETGELVFGDESYTEMEVIRDASEELQGRRPVKEERVVEGLKGERVASQPESQETVAGQLPRGLAGAKPNYSFGRKRFTLQFESDIDRAAYIAARSKKKSKRDAEYVQFVSEQTGLDEAGVRALGVKISAGIKEQARTSEAGALSVKAEPAVQSQQSEVGDAEVEAAERNIRRGEQPEEGAPVFEPRPPGTPPAIGKTTKVNIPDTTKSYEARYEIRELDDLVSSHNGITFTKNPDYYHANDRDYDNELNQGKVLDHAVPENFEPAYWTSNDNTSVNGPSVIDEDGNTLGGNGRLMTMQRIYNNQPEQAAQFVEALKRDAVSLGLAPEEIGRFSQPYPVRVVSNDAIMGDIQGAIREFNITGTGSLTRGESSVSDFRRLSDKSRNLIAAALKRHGDSATLVDALDSDGIEVLNSLIEDGVIHKNELPGFVEDDKLTPEAKTRIKGALVGGFFEDSRQFDSTPNSTIAKLARISPSVIRVESFNGWQLLDDVKGALSLLEAKRDHRLPTIDDVNLQASAFGGPDARKFTPKEIALARLLDTKTTALVATKAFRLYATDAENSQTGNLMDLAEGKSPRTPEDSFAEIFTRGGKNIRDQEAGSAPVPPSLRKAGEAITEGVDVAQEALKLRRTRTAKGRNDLRAPSKVWNTPSYIADKFKAFRPFYRRAVARAEELHRLTAEFSDALIPYLKLTNEQRVAVDRNLILSRKRRTNKMSYRGLDGDQIQAVLAVRKTFNLALEHMKNLAVYVGTKGKLDSAGDVKGEAHLASLLRDTGDSKDVAARRAKKVTGFLADIDRSKREGYVPFSRFGNWGFGLKVAKESTLFPMEPDLKGGKKEEYHVWQQEETEEGAIKAFRKMEKKYASQIASGELEVVKPEDITNYTADYETVGMAELQRLFDISQMDDSLKTRVTDILAPLLENRGFRVHSRKAKDTAGYEADLLRPISDYALSLAGHVARTKMIMDMDGYRISKKQKRLRAYADSYVKYLTEPQQEYSKIRAGLFFWYLGFSPKAAAVNLTQVSLVTAPWLLQYAKTKTVAAEIGKAYKVYGSGLFGKGRDETWFDFTKLPDDVREDAIASLRDGTLRAQLAQELGEYARGHRITKKQKRTQILVDASGKMFGEAELANRVVTFIAAHRIYQQSPVTGFDNALEFAEQSVRDTQFEYGKENRPVLSRGRWAAYMTFKTFPIQYIESYMKLIRRAKDQKRARKALFAMVMASMIASGVEGLIGVQAFMAAMNLILGLTSGEERDLALEGQRWVASLTGKEYAEAIMHGASRPITGFAIGNSVSAGDPFNFAGVIEGDIAGNSALTRMVYDAGATGFPGLVRGNVKDAEKLLPIAGQNLSKAVRYASKGLQNSRGEDLPLDSGGSNKLSPFELLGTAGGFTPAPVTRAYERRNQLRNLTVSSATPQSRFVNRLAQAELGRSDEDVNDIWDEVGKYNSKRPPDRWVNVTQRSVSSRRKVLEKDPIERDLRRVPKAKRDLASESSVVGF